MPLEYYERLYVNAVAPQGYYKVKPDFIFVHFIAEDEVENLPPAPWDGIHYVVPKEMFSTFFDIKTGEWKTPNEANFEEIRAEFIDEIGSIINFCINSNLSPAGYIRGVVNLKYYYIHRYNNFSKDNRSCLVLKGYNPIICSIHSAETVLWGQQFIKDSVIENIICFSRSHNIYCINPLLIDFLEHVLCKF